MRRDLRQPCARTDRNTTDVGHSLPAARYDHASLGAIDHRPRPDSSSELLAAESHQPRLVRHSKARIGAMPQLMTTCRTVPWHSMIELLSAAGTMAKDQSVMSPLHFQARVSDSVGRRNANYQDRIQRGRSGSSVISGRWKSVSALQTLDVMARSGVESAITGANQNARFCHPRNSFRRPHLAHDPSVRVSCWRT